MNRSAHSERHLLYAVQVLLLGLLLARGAVADIYVVGNDSAAVQELTLEQTAAIALGRKVALPGNVRLHLVDQSAAHFVFHDFHHRVTGMSRIRLDSYWARQVFTGQARAPRRLANDDAVVAAIVDDPGLIGYLKEPPPADRGVRVLLVLEGETIRKQ